MGEPRVFVFRAETDQGERDYITLLPPEITTQYGVPAAAIVGTLALPLNANEPISPDHFEANPAFGNFLHEVLGREMPKQTGVQAEAQRVINGWVYLIDQRTPTPDGSVPAVDVLGKIQVKDGYAAAGSYVRNPHHRLLSDNGFFQLEIGLHQCLVDALAELARSS